MKYRNTSLKGKNNYYLIKSDDSTEFTANLEKLSAVKPYLAANIHGFSNAYGETSKNQAYLIFSEKNNKNYLGGVVIVAPIFADEPVEFRIYINEKQVTSDKKIFKIIDEIVNLLGRVNYSSEKITVKLENDIDLNKWNSDKYQKSPYEWEQNSYTCYNTYHQNISMMLEEILNTKKNLEEAGIENITGTVFADPKKFIYPIDNDSITEYRKNMVPFAEVFDKADIYNLSFELPDTSTTSISFKYNGEVAFTNTTSHEQGDWDENYQGRYDYFANSFSLRDYSHRNVEIYNNQDTYYLSNGNLTITHNKNYDLRKICYQTDITDNNTSTITELVIKDGEIKHCYTDLRIHRDSNKKVNGTYMLRWSPEKKLSFTYHNRKGLFEADLTEILKSANPRLYSEVTFTDISMEKLDELFAQVISIVNRTAYQFEEISISNKISALEKDSLRFLEELTEESYTIYLKSIITELIEQLKIDNKVIIKK